MTKEKLELEIIVPQRLSGDIESVLKSTGLDFELTEEHGFGPSSPDVVMTIAVDLLQLLSIGILVAKELWKKNASFSFESRQRLARKMLVDLEPLYPLKGEDTPEYSRYEFKTAKCKHYWEFDHGEIRHGPLRCP